MARSYVEQLKGLWGESFVKSAGQVFTYRNQLGENMYVEENLQARDLRTRLDQGVCCTQPKICRPEATYSETMRTSGQVARGHQEKLMVADGGKDTLYVTSTQWIRCALGGYVPWPLGVQRESIGGGYCGGLHCRHAPVLRACGRTSDCRQAPPPWCGEHHRSHSAVTGGPMTTVCPPRPPLRTILY